MWVLVYNLAKVFFIPGASVPLEQTFSNAAQLVSERRNRLKAKHVKMFGLLNNTGKTRKRYHTENMKYQFYS